MRVDRPAEESPRSERTRAERGSRRVTLGTLTVAVVALLAGLAVAGPVEDRLRRFAEARGFGAFGEVESLRRALVDWPGRAAAARGGETGSLPRLVIDVKFEDLETLRATRAEAEELGVLAGSDDDFVPARIRLEDRSIDVEIRSRPEGLGLAPGEPWPLRVNVDGDDHLFGMRRLSLLPPRVRGFQLGPLFSDALAERDVLVPRYSFVRVVLNGDDLGVMAVEEHFSKELLEAHGRRESVFVRFDRDLRDAERVAAAREYRGESPPPPRFDDHDNLPLTIFQAGRIARSPFLSSDRDVAIGLMRAFETGHMAPSEIFDVERVGDLLAVAEIWGATSILDWENVVFHYDPFTGRLAPVGLGVGVLSVPAADRPLVRNQDFPERLLRDRAISARYGETLRDLADRIDSGEEIERIREREGELLSQVRQGFAFLPELPLDGLEERSRRLAASNVGPVPVPRSGYPVLVHAHLETDESGSSLQLTSAVPHDVVVTGASWMDAAEVDVAPLELTGGASFPIQVAARVGDERPRPVTIRYVAPPGQELLTLTIDVEIPESDHALAQPVPRYPAARERGPVPWSTAEEQLRRHPFLARDEAREAFVVRRGSWQVDGSLIVPNGARLKIAAGVTLSFDVGEGLVARGPVDLLGEPDDPIIMRGRGEKTWMGVTVLRAEEASRWRHAEIRRTSGAHASGWSLTGGVTFYESDLDAMDVRFVSTVAEDALNVYGAEFSLHDCRIFDTRSDGFDADFASGTIVGGSFEKIGTAGGGDAIDVSGSTISVTGTTIEDVSDKALSVGEASVMKAERVTVVDAGAGAASKDGSRLELRDSAIERARVAGLMAYRKKLEYGVASIEATAVSISAGEFTSRAQTGSRIVIDGRETPTEEIDVELLYETVMKKAAR